MEKAPFSIDLLNPSSSGGLTTLSLTTKGFWSVVTLGEYYQASRQPSDKPDLTA